MRARSYLEKGERVLKEGTGWGAVAASLIRNGIERAWYLAYVGTKVEPFGSASKGVFGGGMSQIAPLACGLQGDASFASGSVGYDV